MKSRVLQVFRRYSQAFTDTVNRADSLKMYISVVLNLKVSFILPVTRSLYVSLLLTYQVFLIDSVSVDVIGWFPSS